MEPMVDRMVTCPKCGETIAETGFELSGCIYCGYEQTRRYAVWGRDGSFKYKWMADLVMEWDLLKERFK